MLEASERLPEGGLRAGLRAEACVAAWHERFWINAGHGGQAGSVRPELSEPNLRTNGSFLPKSECFQRWDKFM